jgi:DNA-binding transcriptional LysR family regulator
MDRLGAMSIMVTVAETGSLSAASRRLGTPLPTISRKISELEAHLATRLFVRSTRRLVLTDAGTTYLAACKRILEEIGEAERAATGEFSTPKGELILTAPIVFGRLHLLPAVAAFLAAYPEINVKLTLSDRYVDIIDEHIDLALRIGSLPDSNLVATRVCLVRRVVCGSPAYFDMHGVPKTPAGLSDLDIVTFNAHGSGASWAFRMPGSKKDQVLAISPRLAVNTAEGAIDAAIAGIGVTRVLSYQVERAVAEGRLKLVLVDYETDPIPVNLVHSGQGLLPLKVRSFLDFAVPRLRARLAYHSPTEKRRRKKK